MTQVVLSVTGPDADDAVTLAVPYRGLRNAVLVPLAGFERRDERVVASWTDVGAHPLPRSATAEQVVGIGRAIGGALASVHALGLAHGGVGPATILRDASGLPRLAEAGRAVWSGEAAAPADDVLGLALVLAALLAGDPSDQAAAVRTVLAPALASHPAARPDASALVQALAAAAPPAPLPRPHPVDTGVEIGLVQAGRRRKPAQPRSRRVVGVGLAASVCVAVLVALTGDPRPAPRPAAAASPWDATMRAIAATRWAAFTDADVGRLAAADAPGSPAYTVDAQRVSAYASAHVRVRGAEPTPTVAQVLHAGASVAELVVRESVPAYDEVDDDGTVLARHDAGAPATWRITLVHSSSGWRTDEVTPA